MRFISANSIFSGKDKLPEGSVLVLGNQNLLKDIISENDVDPGNVQRYEGIITPGFVNAHCHLELSHLKGVIPVHTGLPEFGKNVITQRPKYHAEEINEHMQEADREMWNNGVVVVGDISNDAASFDLKTRSKITYHTFIELLGFDPRKSAEVLSAGIRLLSFLKNMGLPGSLAPHAPYSVSKELIGMIAEYDAGLNEPMSIHNQESAEETKFFKGEKNAFQDLYRFLGMDTSWFKAPGISSLAHIIDFTRKAGTMLVHNTCSTAEDIALAGDHAWWCFCPAANKYIEDRLPKFELFAGKKEKICIGTDSLASNSFLDPLREVNLILSHSNVFSPEDLLRAITYNPASAIGLERDFGHLRGNKAGLNLVRLSQGQFKFIQKIV